ncbi:hypothetical protein M0804_004103 [Polistes exclamans]|nr:hypothetical protein M0804_004103 [Polistes exclamans]
MQRLSLGCRWVCDSVGMVTSKRVEGPRELKKGRERRQLVGSAYHKLASGLREAWTSSRVWRNSIPGAFGKACCFSQPVPGSLLFAYKAPCQKKERERIIN